MIGTRRPRWAMLIANPAAGGTSPSRVERAALCLRDLGIALETAITTRPGEATAIARQAAAQGIDAVIAMGGDGTINEVINGVVGSDAVVGVIPAGTVNVLARETGIPVKTDRRRRGDRRRPL